MTVAVNWNHNPLSKWAVSVVFEYGSSIPFISIPASVPWNGSEFLAIGWHLARSWQLAFSKHSCEQATLLSRLLYCASWTFLRKRSSRAGNLFRQTSNLSRQHSWASHLSEQATNLNRLLYWAGISLGYGTEQVTNLRTILNRQLHLEGNFTWKATILSRKLTWAGCFTEQPTLLSRKLTWAGNWLEQASNTFRQLA